MITGPFLTALLIAVCIGALLALFLDPGLKEGAYEQRLNLLSMGRIGRKAVKEAQERRDQMLNSLKEIENRSKSKRITLEQNLVYAGLEWSKKQYYLISLVVAALVFVGAFVIFENFFASIVAGAVFGRFLPGAYINYHIRKRRDVFVTMLPDAIESIVRGIRSGLPLGDCFRLIASEAREPLRGEFRFIVEAQMVGLTLPEACEKITDRFPITEVRFFAQAIRIQSKSGGNLAEILMNLSKVIRDRKKLLEKVKSLSMEAKASTYIIGSMPFLVFGAVYYLNPGYLKPLWTTTPGYFILGYCFFSMAFGVFIMNKMIDIEV